MSEPIENGEIADADSVMNAMASIWNDSAQNLFNQAYIGFDNKLNGDGAPDLKNVTYSIFDTDDAISTNNFFYNATDDVYIAPGTHIIIEADDATVSWTNNDTELVKLSTGRWILYSSEISDDTEVKRAKLHKSLWYGTDGTDQLILDFTNVTDIKTSTTRDIGKQAHFSRMATDSFTGGGVQTYTGTFVDTSTNTDCSTWSKLRAPDTSPIDVRWEIPDGTIVNQETSPSATSDELGTDLSSDELDNPADCQLYTSNTTTDGGRNMDAIILCVGDITWASSGTRATFSNVDFLATYSIPLITATDLSTSTITFGTTTDVGEDVTNIIPIVNNTFDSGSATLEFSNDNSTYESCTNKEIHRPTTTGQKRLVRLTATSGTDVYVTEQAIKHNLY